MANRRELLLGLGAALLAGGTGRLVEAAAPGSWVLYVAAADCRVCRGWEVDHQAAFVQGLRRHGIGFRQITVTSLRNVRDDAAWTPDLAWIRDSNPNMRGTPWFFLVSGRTIETAANSTDLWRMKFAPLAA
jgi:hypothetical protein